MSDGARHYLDSNTLIAIFEASSGLTVGQIRFVAGIEAGLVSAVSSDIALAECLVKPMADRDEIGIVDWLDFLLDRPTLPLVAIDRSTFIEAARLRAASRVKLPDAIHLAAAEAARCDVFLSNDTRLEGACPIAFQLWSSIGDDD